MPLKWSKWKAMPDSTYQGTPVSFSNLTPVVVSTAPGDANLFMLDKNRNLYQTFWDGTQWAEWRPLGGEFNNIPSVVSRGKGLLDIVGLGTNNRMYYKGWNGTNFFSWENGHENLDAQAWGTPIGGPVSNFPLSITKWPGNKNRMDVCAVADNGNLLHMQITDGRTWFGKENEKETWNNLGGICTSKAVTYCRADGYLDVFVRNTEGGITYKGKHDAAWTDWHRFPDIIAEAPAVVSRMGATLDIVGRSPSSHDESYHLKKIYWDGVGTWGPKDEKGEQYWEDLGAPYKGRYFKDSPVMISRKTDSLDIFGIGGYHPTFNSVQNMVNTDIFYKSWNGNGWAPRSSEEAWPIVADGLNDDWLGHYAKVNAICAVAINDKKVQVIASFNDEANRKFPLYYTEGTEM